MHFEFIFVFDVRKYSNFILLHVAVQLFPALFIEDAVFAPLCILASFVKNKVPMRVLCAANACTVAQPWVVGPANRSYQLRG